MKYNQTGRPHACMTCQKAASCKAKPQDGKTTVESCTGYLGLHATIRQVICYG